jgi:bacterioferritin-associated ferredoxin
MMVRTRYVCACSSVRSRELCAAVQMMVGAVTSYSNVRTRSRSAAVTSAGVGHLVRMSFAVSTAGGIGCPDG